jgi:hypothetical protein
MSLEFSRAPSPFFCRGRAEPARGTDILYRPRWLVAVAVRGRAVERRKCAVPGCGRCSSRGRTVLATARPEDPFRPRLRLRELCRSGTCRAEHAGGTSEFGLPLISSPSGGTLRGAIPFSRAGERAQIGSSASSAGPTTSVQTNRVISPMFSRAKSRSTPRITYVWPSTITSPLTRGSSPPCAPRGAANQPDLFDPRAGSVQPAHRRPTGRGASGRARAHRPRSRSRVTRASRQLPRAQWRSALRQPSTSACRSLCRHALKKSACPESCPPEASVAPVPPVVG